SKGYPSGNFTHGAQVIIRSPRRLEDFLKPIRISLTDKSLLFIVTSRIDQCPKLVRTKHIRDSPRLLSGQHGGYRKAQLITFNFLCSNQQHAGGRPRSRDSLCTSIFQNRRTFDIVRVSEAQKITTITTDTSGL